MIKNFVYLVNMFGRKKKQHSTFARFAKEPRQIKVKIKDIKKVNWKPWFWGCFFIFLAGGAVYFFVFSPAFKINQITVAGGEFSGVEEVKLTVQKFISGKVLKFINQDNLTILSASRLEKTILDSFPALRTAEVKKVLPHRLEISVQERQEAAIWCQSQPAPANVPISAIASSSPTQIEEINNVLPESERCFFIDQEGILFRSAPQISGTLLPSIFFQSGAIFDLKSRAMSSSTIQFIVEAKKSLRQIGVEAVGFISGEGDTVDIKALTSQGWFIYFDLTRSVLSQVRSLEILLAGEIKNKQSALKYVDLRIMNKIYYK